MIKIKTLFDKKLLRFLIVGAVNTLVGTAIMFGLYNLAKCSYWVSTASNLILASILSFFLNKNYTFKNKSGLPKTAGKFALNVSLCYLLAYGLLKPFVFHILSGYNPRIQGNITMLVGMCVFSGLNYLGQRFFVFKND